jgi:transcriptional regulator with XRE-family HTH domain
VLGSYERGDRAMTVQKLTELAGFYGVPVNELLPHSGSNATPDGAPKLVVNLQRLHKLSGDEVGP